MEWSEITIKVASKDLETASAIATAASPGGLYIEDYSDMEQLLATSGYYDYVDRSLLEKDTDYSVIHVYLPPDLSSKEATTFVEDRLRAEGIGYELLMGTVKETDWAESWKRYYHMQKIGERLVVRPSWEKYEEKEGEAVVILDPGMSFGTGEHETTRLCLELLERELKGGERVLDIGTGSGILSIAAIKLGASSVTSVDIDPNAVRIAIENAAENGIVPPQMRALSGNINDAAFSKELGDGYDMLLANIVADVIIPAAGGFFEKLRPGGTLITSGIIGPRVEDVEAALKAAGFTRKETARMNDWAAILAGK